MEWIESVARYLPDSAAYMLPILGALHAVGYGIWRGSPRIGLGGLLLLLFLIVLFYPLILLLPDLTVDSFREAATFDFKEGLFYLTTLRGEAYSQVTGKWILKWTAVYLAYGVVFVLLSAWIKRRGWRIGSRQLNLAAILVLVMPPLAYSSFVAAKGFVQARAETAQVQRNFADVRGLVEAEADPANDLTVVLYIGESTSRMNWGLYGYPRNTTPALEALERQGQLIRFDNVDSPHVYTSSSLLEILSIEKQPKPSDVRPVPIFQQPRIALVDVLADAGIQTSLFSNQSRYGTWNLASQTIFKNARDTHFTTSRQLGNLDYLDDTRPFDHEFLRGFWEAVRSGRTRDSRLLVFHSYAGHGGYADFIPRAYRRPVDDFLRGLSIEAVAGRSSSSASIGQIEEYDAAMRYVSDNLARSIRDMERSDKPMVLVYFPDHGESVYTGQGHDAVRYVWEMGAIPFLMHFNAAARRDYPQLVAKYRQRAKEQQAVSLANLPSLIFDLLGVRVRQRDGRLHPASQCGFAAGRCEPRYHLVQQEVGGTVTFVARPNIGDGTPPRGKDTTDRDTAHYNLAHQIAGVAGYPAICMHRANSLARIIRARAVTDCMELDVNVTGREVWVFHSPGEETGLSLDKALSALGNRPTTVWLDAKNIGSPAQCAVLADAVVRRIPGPLRFFVEFPPDSVGQLEALRVCSQRLDRAGVARSFYVPTETAVQCAREVGQGSRGKACRLLDTLLAKVARSGQFTDLSFDFLAYRAIANAPAAQGLRWNTWDISDEDVLRLRNGKFRLVLPRPSNFSFN